MYGHDIVNNSIYLVNRNTGAVTLVGPTGYDANYAQGMDFDNDTGTLYIFLFDFGSFGTIYGTVDLNTGAVTPLAFAQDLEYEGAVQNTSYCAAAGCALAVAEPDHRHHRCRRQHAGSGNLQRHRPGCRHLHLAVVHPQQRPRCRPRQRHQPGDRAGDPPGHQPVPGRRGDRCADHHRPDLQPPGARQPRLLPRPVRRHARAL